MYTVTPSFRDALTAPIRDVTIRVTALDANFVPIADITDPTTEGSVYVDVDRATRRTAQIRLINKNGAYTPKGGDYTSLGTNALFWWNKVFKIEYGVKVGGVYQYVPLGMFMVDKTEVLAERGVSVLNIDGSDLWKRFSSSTFAAPVAYSKNTSYNTIISAIAASAGVSKINLDPLASRGTTEKTAQVPIFFEADENRGDVLKKLAADWNLDIYFDVTGYLVTTDMNTVNATLNAAPQWTFAPGREAIFLNISKSKSGDTIKNHIVVTGENDDNIPVVRGEAIDDFGTSTSSVYYSNSYSTTSVDEIGDRVKHITSTTLRTTAACLDLAKAELMKNRLVEEEINLPTIVVPMFEGRDVIRISEPDSDTDDNYFLSRFDIPMRSSSQQISVKKIQEVS